MSQSDAGTPADASADVANEDRSVEDTTDDGADELPRGYCDGDDDCGASGACDEGFCVRVDPVEDSAKCNGVFHNPPGSACAIHPVTGDVVTLRNAECGEDSDCDESPYGPRCIYGACTVLEACDDDGSCAEPDQTCSEGYEVCLLPSDG